MSSRLKHVKDEEWLKLAACAGGSVGKLAKLCNVSVRGLELHFLKKMGRTPKHWLTEQRLKKAMELLADGALVKETAAKLGYKHATHFSRKFKKHWGHCPKQIVSTTPILRVLV
jgi:transcriptional regulator GlxA family with amidase domain